ncbi:hypothetical protein Tco_1144347 [Tanacetum coccineum]
MKRNHALSNSKQAAGRVTCAILYEIKLVTNWKETMVLFYKKNLFQEMDHRYNTTAENPVQEIFIKLNLLIIVDPTDQRLFKDGGGDFRCSDTTHLSRSVNVLKLKNFKKDVTLKLYKSSNQEWYEHVGPEVASPQDDKVQDQKRLCLVDDLNMLKITMSNTSSRNKLNPEVNDHYNIFSRESQEYELKTKDEA